MDPNAIPDSLVRVLFLSIFLFFGAGGMLTAACGGSKTATHARRIQWRRYGFTALAAIMSMLALALPFLGHDASLVFDTLRFAWHELAPVGWALNLGFYGSIGTLLAAAPVTLYIHRHPVEQTPPLIIKMQWPHQTF